MSARAAPKGKVQANVVPAPAVAGGEVVSLKESKTQVRASPLRRKARFCLSLFFFLFFFFFCLLFLGGDGRERAGRVADAERRCARHAAQLLRYLNNEVERVGKGLRDEAEAREKIERWIKESYRPTLAKVRRTATKRK